MPKMEQKIRITSSVEKDKWAQFVEENPYGNIFQTPEMAEVFSRTNCMEPISLFAIDENDEILASVLAFVSTEKKGVFEFVSKRAVISGGPLFSNNEMGFKALPKLTQEYDKIASKKSMFTEMRMLYRIPEFSILKDINYSYEDHLNFLLDLSPSEEILWGNISNSRRRAIKRSRKAGVEVEKIEDKRDIQLSYDLLKDTYSRVKIPLPDISLFESAFEVLIPMNYMNVFLYKQEEDIIATRIILTYKDMVYCWYTGSNQKKLDLRPNDFSQWHAIEWAKENGYSTLDFGGAGKPNRPYGPRKFKKTFGGTLVNLGRYSKVYHTTRLKIAKIGYEICRRFFMR